jgi:hypothetical protein
MEVIRDRGSVFVEQALHPFHAEGGRNGGERWRGAGVRADARFVGVDA